MQTKHHIISISKKFFLFSFIFSIFIHQSGLIINAKTFPSSKQSTKTDVIQNSIQYQRIDTPILSNVGVAIATSIGIDFLDTQKTESIQYTGINSSYDEILDINDMISNPEKVRITMIQKNMLIIKEYLAYLKNDLKADLENTENRELFLSQYIEQLKFRYKKATQSQSTLIAQRTYLESIIVNANLKIDGIKINLSTNFRSYNDRGVSLDVENYLTQSEIKRVASTYLVFTNKFLEQYEFLNDYNKELLDTLILNKKAISTESYVVIPDSGSKILEDINLLYDEEQFKGKE